jgi:hypothetical protein
MPNRVLGSDDSYLNLEPHMRRVMHVVALLASIPLALSAQARPASQAAILGAWKIAEVVVTGGPNPRTISNPQPSLYLYTRRHYSQLVITSEGPRPAFAQQQDNTKLTDAEKIARFEQWNLITANSGTYDIKNDTLTFHPLVAKTDSVMRSSYSTKRAVRIEPNTLWFTTKSPSTGAETKTRLTRVD